MIQLAQDFDRSGGPASPVRKPTDYLHELQMDVASEPRRVCRRLQLLSRMEHHEQDNEQVFPRSA